LFATIILLLINTIANSQNISPTVIGGQQIAISQAPWQVSVRGTTSSGGTHPFYGGGSIISPTWILTAAHVAVTLTPGRGWIRAGTNINYNSNTSNSTEGQLIKIAQVIIHPGWNNGNLQNDIALLRLEQPLVLNAEAQPIQYETSYNLPNNLTTPGNTATITGWGGTCNGCNTSVYLNGIDMPIISNQDANQRNLTASYYNPNYIVTPEMIAVFQNNGSASPGDSGGAVTVLNGATPIQIGIMSWAYDPKGQYPTINTRVKSYQQWIQNTTAFSLTVSPVSRIIPQLDDIYIVRWDAFTWGGDGGYTYSWEVDYNNGAGFIPVNNPSSILQITTSNPNICARVLVTSNGQSTQAQVCANGGGESTFRAYPNPADNSITVEEKEPVHVSDSSTREVELYNQQGNLKFTGHLQKGLLNINTNNLPNGNYRILIKNKGKIKNQQIQIIH